MVQVPSLQNCYTPFGSDLVRLRSCQLCPMQSFSSQCLQNLQSPRLVCSSGSSVQCTPTSVEGSAQMCAVESTNSEGAPAVHGVPFELRGVFPARGIIAALLNWRLLCHVQIWLELHCACADVQADPPVAQLPTPPCPRLLYSIALEHPICEAS